MDQKAYLSLTAMLNAFPQTSADVDLTMRTFEAALSDISAQAITETALRFAKGEVSDQSLRFAPSCAEFSFEARRVDALIPYRGRKALPAPEVTDQPKPTPEEKVRLGFKLSLLSQAMGVEGGPDRVRKASAAGVSALIALGNEWNVPVPDELREQTRRAA